LVDKPSVIYTPRPDGRNDAAIVGHKEGASPTSLRFWEKWLIGL
jgi:hypothetical protein